jgi:hypothetical protein
MATISIFSIRLGRLLLTCERDAVFSYVLTCQGVRSPMSTDVAAALGGAASRMILFEAVKHLAPWPLNDKYDADRPFRRFSCCVRWLANKGRTNQLNPRFALSFWLDQCRG